MKTHDDLIQGSPQWHAHRATHFNASDAPAMMGLSAYTTRTQLLHQLHTGIAPEVDDATQRRFDDGHRFEALARPLAEKIIGEDLYPVVGSEGELSASFDGLTMDERINFEHKSLNEGLRAIMVDGCNGADLDMQYQVQMEQQHMVSGAEKTLFMASKWDGDTLVEERHCWYETNLELRQQITAGWAQFAKDLTAYVPIAPTVQAVAAPVESLPAVSVRLDGQLVVASNLPDFGVALRAFIAKIPAKPSTDQDFADTESACKALKKAEEALDSAETHALAQMTDVESMRRTVADLKELARCTRLASEKFVTQRKEQIRIEIVTEGHKALAMHLDSLNKRLGHPYMPMVQADFAGAIKGKRTIDSLRDAVSTTLANAKIEASSIADKIQFNLGTLNEAVEFAFLFSDVMQIVKKAPEDLKALVQNRVGAHKAAEAVKEEATRQRIEAEVKAKAEREARAKLADEQAKAALAERDRVAEQAAFEQLERDEIARLAKLNTTMVVEAPVAPVSTVVPMPARMPAVQPAPVSPPTLRLGQIGERLGFGLTAEFLKNLGFEPAATEKTSKLFHESDFPLICMRLVSHIQRVQTKQAA